MNFQPDEQMKHDYIQDKLSPEAKTDFEMWLFENPDEQEELELDLILKAGVKKHFDSVSKRNATKNNWLPAAGIAAAFVLIAWSLLTTNNSINDSRIMAPQVSVFSQVRSAEQLTWELNAKEAQLIQIPVGYLSTDLYQITVSTKGEDPEKVLEIKDLKPNFDMVSVIISENSLPAGEYQLQLIGQEGDENELFKIQVN